MTKTRSISQFLPSFRAATAAALLVMLAVIGPASAQAPLETPVLTIDLERLFAETQLGAAKLEEFDQAVQALAAENKQIENSLIAAEKELTEQRADLTPEDFRDRADAFNERVQKLRAEQDEKERQLGRTRDEARAAFYTEVNAIISEIVREKGALVVLDRRDVFLSAGRIDITDQAILRVNQAEGRTAD